MKKLLLLLLIAPMIGNSQLLNLPVSEVIVINQFNSYYTVPQGKVAQLVSSSFKAPNRDSNNYSDTVTPRLDEDCLTLVFINDVWYQGSTIYGNTVLPEYTQIGMEDSGCWDGAYSFVIFDLNAQNLASNAPQQTTPATNRFCLRLTCDRYQSSMVCRLRKDPNLGICSPLEVGLTLQ